MRLFISINLSQPTRAALASFSDELRACSKRGTFSPPENLHLTLAFLGECDEQQTARAKHAVGTVRFAPFSITVAGGGYLDRERPNLVFCGLRNDRGYDSLRRLESQLRVNLTAKGLNLEQREFWPHITLGRKVVWNDMGGIQIGARFPVMEEPVTSIALMKSERIDARLTYTPILKKELSI